MTTKDKDAKGQGRHEGSIICKGHSRPVPDCVYSRMTEDGFFLASSCLDGKPMIRDGRTGDWIGTLQGHKGAVWATRLNSGATQALTASADFTSTLWDAITGEALHSFAHKHIVRACIFSPGDESAYTGGKESKLRIFDLSKPSAEPTVLEGTKGGIVSLAVTADDNLVLSAGGEESFVRVWDKRTGKAEKNLQTAAPVTSLQTSMDGGILSAAAGKHVYFWDTKSLSLAKSYELGRVSECVAYHATPDIFVTGGGDLWAHAHDFKTGSELAVNKGHHGPVSCIAFTPAGDSYASGSIDGTIRIWEWTRPDNSKPSAEQDGAKPEKPKPE